MAGIFILRDEDRVIWYIVPNYFALSNAATNDYNQGNYADAVNKYAAAINLAKSTYDTNLKVYHNKHSKTSQYYLNALNAYQSQQGIQNVQTNTVGTYYGGNVNTEYENTTTTTTRTKVKHTCRLCNGSGVQTKDVYLGSAAKPKYCVTCGRDKPAGHRHITCTLCNGVGYNEY